MRDNPANYDELSDAWRSVEEWLKTLRCHQGVWVDIPGLSLGLDKWKGQWHVLIRKDDLTTPIYDVSLALRIKATEHVETLLAAVLDQKSKVSKDVEEATDRLTDFLQRHKEQP